MAQLWQQYGFWILVSAWFLFLGLFLAIYLRAVRPRSGTLEWIYEDTATPFVLAGTRHPLTQKDGLWLTFAAVIGALVRTLWGILAMGTWNTANGVTEFFSVATHQCLPGLACLAVYWLVKSMYGSTLVAAISAILLAFDVYGNTTVVAVTALTLALTYGYITMAKTATFVEKLPVLLALSAVLALGIYVYLGLCVLIFGVLLLLALGAYEDFVQGNGFWSTYLLTVGTLLVAMVAVTWFLYIPAALSWNLPISTLVISPQYYALIGQRLLAAWYGNFARPNLIFATFDLFRFWPAASLCLFAAIANFHGFLRHHQAAPLLVLIILLTLAAMWLTAGLPAFSLALTLSMAYVWNKLRQKHRPTCFAFSLILAYGTVLGATFI